VQHYPIRTIDKAQNRRPIQAIVAQHYTERIMFISNKRSAYPQARPHLLEALGAKGRARATDYLNACPMNKPTPLYAMPNLAATLGIGSLAIKDEGQRLGLKSFKALGGAYAVMSLILSEAEKRLRSALKPADLVSPLVKNIAATLTVTCATDGNHGRSVAAGARIAGCACVIFVHGGVSQERADAIGRYGAEIRRTTGTYDDSVREAAEAAKRERWIVVSDTSWDGYEDIPLTVMQGYTIMAGEAFDALQKPPTHIFLQAGVGGMAAAVAAHSHAVYGTACPKIIVVEPARAACLFASAIAQKRVEIPHGQATIMGMLECYAPSAIAWEILSPLASGYVTLEEDDAIAAMKLLAFPGGNDPAIVSGESGGTGLAGLIACLKDEAAIKALGLDQNSRVLVFNSEGATDPALYEKLIGKREQDIIAKNGLFV
jgi:diaminopropionate ammonia-lyase